MNEFKVGDKVTVFRTTMAHGIIPKKIISVSKVLSRHIVLSDLSKWNLHGGPYPRKSDYSVSRIEHTTNEHLMDMKILRLRYSIKAWVEKNIDKCDLSTLEKINKVIDESTD